MINTTGDAPVYDSQQLHDIEQIARRAEQAEASAASRARHQAAREAAEQAAVDQVAADRADLDAVPVDDEVDADPEVAAIEERIASGDDTATLAQLAEVRTAAAGRVRFARLRTLGADRRARRDAEDAERAAAEAADAHAREVLGPFRPVEFVEVYDAAVAAVRAYSDLVAGYNDVLVALGLLPRDERPRSLVTHRESWGPVPAHLPEFDGRAWTPQNHDLHIERVLAAAGIAKNGIRVAGSIYAVDGSDPVLVAEGRALLAGG